MEDNYRLITKYIYKTVYPTAGSAKGVRGCSEIFTCANFVFSNVQVSIVRKEIYKCIFYFLETHSKQVGEGGGITTSTTEIYFSPPVCLSVSLKIARYLKTLWMDSDNIWWTG